MALPLTGPITIGDVATELGLTLPLTLGDSRVLELAGKTVKPISLGDLRGKSATPAGMSGNIPDVYWSDAPPGVNGTIPVPVEVNVLGGTAPYAYSWYVVGVNDVRTVDNTGTTTSNANIYVNRFAEAGEVYTGQVGCDVTDGLGNVLSLTGNVTLELW